MKCIIKVTLILIGLLSGLCTGAVERKYRLSLDSDEYNTYYFYCSNTNQYFMADEIVYVDKIFPSSFVVEINSLRNGERSALIYNDTSELLISKELGRYRINQYTVNRYTEGERKLSFYFVNQMIVFYINEEYVFEFPLQYDHKKKIGVKRGLRNGNVCRFLNCYTPVPFKVADYGNALDDCNLNSTRGIRIRPHNVGMDYSLTYPSDVTCDSKRSIRFEYRFEDTKAGNVNAMRRARSEISGVFCNSPRNKWIIEYDLLIPQETKDDKAYSEIITQIQKESKIPIGPAFCLNILDGWLKCSIQGDSVPVGEWQGKRQATHWAYPRLQCLDKGRWHHIKIYLKEGIQYSDLPLTKVWVDGVLKLESHQPNCYSYDPTKAGLYDYLKFGVYKPGWKNLKENPSTLGNRVYYFDNVVVKY